LASSARRNERLETNTLLSVRFPMPHREDPGMPSSQCDENPNNPRPRRTVELAQQRRDIVQ